MKKEKKILLFIIAVLIIILGVLVKFTIDSISKNKSSQIDINKPSGSMSGQMGGSSNSITYSSAKEINGDTSITTATISLSNNTIINNDKIGNFLRVQKDSWGKTDNN